MTLSLFIYQSFLRSIDTQNPSKHYTTEPLTMSVTEREKYTYNEHMQNF